MSQLMDAEVPSQSNFFDNLLTVCDLALAANKRTAIMGDLNCNLLTPSLLNIKLLSSFCRQLKLTELVCTPTRLTDSSVGQLDVILTNTPDHFHQTFAILFSISDHLVLTHLTPKLKSTLMSICIGRGICLLIYHPSYVNYADSHVFACALKCMRLL